LLNLVDIVRNLVTGIGLQIQVSSIVGVQIFVCESTSFLTIGKIVTDSGGFQYKVVAISINEWVELEPFGHAIPFSDTVINLPSITYLHGSPQTTNNEYQELDQSSLSKTPFIWLLETYQYQIPEADSSLGGIFDVVLFALDWADDRWRI
jgi:hypothetical protein